MIALIIKLNKNNLKKIKFNQINYQNQILNEKFKIEILLDVLI